MVLDHQQFLSPHFIPPYPFENRLTDQLKSAPNLRMHFLHEFANAFVCFTLAPGLQPIFSCSWWVEVLVRKDPSRRFLKFFEK